MAENQGDKESQNYKYDYDYWQWGGCTPCPYYPQYDASMRPPASYCPGDVGSATATTSDASGVRVVSDTDEESESDTSSTKKVLSKLGVHGDRGHYLEILLEKSGPYIGSNFAKELGYTGKDVIVAVIDTGVDYYHQDLNGFSDTIGQNS